MPNQYSRTELLIGEENIKKLQQSKVAIFGVGGVGSFVVEALARAGVGALVIIDHDEVDITNDATLMIVLLFVVLFIFIIGVVVVLYIIIKQGNCCSKEKNEENRNPSSISLINRMSE